MEIVYQAVFTPWEDEEGGFTAKFPDLSGCITEGDTLEEAKAMAKEVAEGWFEATEPIPEPKNHRVSETADGILILGIIIEL